MRYNAILFLVYFSSNSLLQAEEKGLGNILQEAGVEKKVLKESAHTKQHSSKASRFIFKDEYRSNNLGVKDKTVSAPQESKSYTYENKSRFQFKFNDGTQSNFVAGQRSPDSVVPIGGGFIGGAPIGGTPIGMGQGGNGGGGGRR